ncbi:CocE/NonD family hydrolase [Dictyobacter formicarum]|uniref:X-Pro dipeptidyl-peptidase n=1 Tax=Dictyobacter formicarum TaxID=2778368 RepID=A0ABQ3VBB9_9CHLR|nr:CocE/NonD family hydrolase [Dictyobacter formicarum]GHO83442.1 X-Pro dipeptidyl-peptidase [Dictyobacter formicarum]
MSVQPGLSVKIEFDVPAQMRDGVTLRANVYRPEGEGQWPVLLTRLPYGKDFPSAAGVLDPVQAARRGYVVIVQDTRGRFASDGEWSPMRREALDGLDTIAWASQLPYSNGEVGMFGASYFGFTQWSAAVHQPVALKTFIPYITWNDPLNGVMFRGGALELGTTASWQLAMAANVLMRRHVIERDPVQLGTDMYTWAKTMDTLGSQGYWSLPLKDFAPLKYKNMAPDFYDVFEKPMSPELVEPMTILGKHDQVTVPTFNIGGWYDIFLQDTLENFRIMREDGSTPAAKQSQLLIGPWIHGGSSNPVGEKNFGFAAMPGLLDLKSDIMSMQLRWFDHFLKGQDTGILSEAPIKLFVMGANVWRDEQEWPLARAVETRYYLHSAGQANTLDGDGTLSTEVPEVEQPDTYTYDPANPVITRGGALLMTPEYPGGVFDQRPTEQRPDVLVYTTPALMQDVEVTGPILVHLWAISSAVDTDFVARLVDVYPDGYAQNLTDGIIRARYRNFSTDAEPALIEPGQAYEYVIDLWSTSNVFKQGHRIRLDITSSNFPRWDRNPNTGHVLGADNELVIAHQTLLHDAAHPSFVALPIIPVTA